MKIASHIRSRQAKAENQGFTLIELLVVISIIAVLAGLLFPAMGAVRTMARKTSAKNDITQIVNGVKMFYTEYGRYPLPGDQAVFTAGNGELIGVLRSSGTSHSNTLNPRKVRFLEVPNAKDGRSGLQMPSGSTANPASNADWVDPWRRPYLVFISKDYNGQVTTSSLNPTSFNKTLDTEVAAASKGKDDDSVKNDPVVSWQ